MPADKRANNMRQVGLAMRQYWDTHHGQFPLTDELLEGFGDINGNGQVTNTDLQGLSCQSRLRLLCWLLAVFSPSLFAG